jgi:hypothetical protein
VAPGGTYFFRWQNARRKIRLEPARLGCGVTNAIPQTDGFYDHFTTFSVTFPTTADCVGSTYAIAYDDGIPSAEDVVRLTAACAS